MQRTPPAVSGLYRGLAYALAFNVAIVAAVQWSVLAVTDAGTAARTHGSWLVVAAASAVPLLWGFRMVAGVLAPIQQLTRLARIAVRCASGPLRADAPRAKELKELTTAFNALLDGSKATTERLRAERDSERRRSVALEKELDRMHEAAERAEGLQRARLRFLEHVGDEIRTPIRGIRSTTDRLLDSGDISHSVHEGLKVIRASSNSVVRFVDDMRHLAELEGGAVTVDNAGFDLRELVADAVAPFESEAVQKGTAIHVEIDRSIPERLVGDAARLTELLERWVDNAVKFTSAGSVTVRVDRAPSRDESRRGFRIVFAVEDTGVGIDEARCRELREVFDATRGVEVPRLGGAGLGLPITARIAACLGGELELESRAGEGTRLQMELRMLMDPASSVPDAAAGDEERADRSNARDPRLETSTTMEETMNREKQQDGGMLILLAEDNPVNQKLTIRMLEKRGHRVDLAENGRIAVEMYEDGVYDLILMDVMMPEMDGLEATGAIRRRESETGKHVPIVALTANAMKGDRERCLDSGMDRYLSKPIRPADLYEAVESFRSEPEVATVVAEPCASHGGGGSRDVFDRDQMLERLGCDEELLVEILDLFVQDAPTQFANLTSAIEARETELVTRHAHTLKGQAANIAAARMKGVSYEMETAAREGDLDRATTLLPRMREVFDELLDALRA